MRVYEAVEPTAGSEAGAASQADLLDRARAGEREAFTALVERFHPELVRIAFAITGDVDAARDAAQLAWVKAWQRLPTVRQPDRLHGWLIAIAANEARQQVRASRRRHVREIEPVGADVRDGGDPHASADRVDLGRALVRLAAADRALLAMRYLGGLTAEEIGAATGVTGSAVRSRLSRLIARLREELDDD
jgi:RNA polymerase sigma-70 factor (ECF subfamily)